MIAVVRQFPVRSVLLGITLVVFTVDMWTGWTGWLVATVLTGPLVLQAVYLAKAMGLEPVNDPAASQNGKTC